MNKLYITIGVLRLLVLRFMVSCAGQHYTRGSYERTVNPGNHLYQKTYITCGQGAWGTSEEGDCLTDSTNFRICLGQYDEDGEWIDVHCKGDNVFVTKHFNPAIHNPPLKTEFGQFKISALKQLHNCYRLETFQGFMRWYPL